MEFIANEGKNVEICVEGEVFKRHAIKTRFIKPGDDYIDIFKEYVSPIYEEGDIVSSCEKVISLCQNRVIKREDIKIGFFAKFLSKFASHPKEAGIGVGESIKMQYAIDKVGMPRVLFASFCSAITKIFGMKGVFYKIVGQDISGLDGFYGDVWEEYTDIGIELPANPTSVCNIIQKELGISVMIVDSNDFGREILGKSDDIGIDDTKLKKIIRDNPTRAR